VTGDEPRVRRRGHWDAAGVLEGLNVGVRVSVPANEVPRDVACSPSRNPNLRWHLPNYRTPAGYVTALAIPPIYTKQPNIPFDYSRHENQPNRASQRVPCPTQVRPRVCRPLRPWAINLQWAIPCLRPARTEFRMAAKQPQRLTVRGEQRATVLSWDPNHKPSATSGPKRKTHKKSKRPLGTQ